MNKKIMVVSLIVLVIIICLIFVFIFNKNNNNATINNNTQKQDEIKDEKTSDKKIAIVYFSATGTTKTVAEYIKDETKGDIFEIIPKQKYESDDLNYNNSNSRATKEQNDKNARPEIANNINVSNYDIIFIGYPIWWGDTPRIIQTFIESHELKGKTMIPFCTSGSSGITGSESTLKSYKGINWIAGKRLSGSKSDVSSWVKSLNY